jgi:hypothetical protein
VAYPWFRLGRWLGRHRLGLNLQGASSGIEVEAQSSARAVSELERAELA